MTPEERSAGSCALGCRAGRPSAGLDTQGRKGPSLRARLARAFLVILLILGGVFGYWVWYVTSAGSQFTSPDMDLNDMMPAPLNRWGCDPLKKRFGDQRAPFGCAASDYTSWK